MTRFYPLADSVRHGVIVSPDDKPRAAQSLTPQEAKDEAQKRRRA